jgi:PAS domain S-box-containing protein
MGTVANSDLVPSEKGITERLRDRRLKTQVRILDLLQRSVALLSLQKGVVCEPDASTGHLRVFQALGRRFQVGQHYPELDRLREFASTTRQDVLLSRDLPKDSGLGQELSGVGAGIMANFRLAGQPFLILLFSGKPWRTGFDAQAENGFRLLLEAVRALLQRIHVEEELRRANTRFRRFFHLGPLGSAILSPSGHWTTVNDRLCNLLGRNRGELSVATWESLTQESDRRREGRVYQRMLAGEIDEYQLEKSFVLPDGGLVPVLVTARILRRANGRVEAVMVLVEDLSERRQAEEERGRLQEQLLQAQKMESLGLLAGGIAHDFNNLLTGVIGNADLIRLELGEGHAAAAPLEHLLDAGQQAARLTRQLLAYSGQRGLRMRSLDLSREVQEQSSLLDTLIPKRVELRLDLGVQVPAVQADKVQLQQIVMNLVINGAEACGEESGTVWIRTGSAFLDPLVPDDYALAPESAGTYAWIEVLDTGSGMSPADLTKIFDPFYSTKFTGRGLGLAAVIGIVRGHRGAIKVTSTLGSGSVFRVFFPCARLEEDLTPTNRSRSDKRVALVIDDEQAVRRVCSAVLRRKGWKVQVASGGLEGVALLRRLEPQLALVDMTMPDIDGAETCRRLRAELPDLPILFMSGFAELAIRDRLPAEGNYGFLHKPFTPSQLMESVGDTLAGAGEGQPQAAGSGPSPGL